MRLTAAAPTLTALAEEAMWIIESWCWLGIRVGQDILREAVKFAVRPLRGRATQCQETSTIDELVTLRTLDLLERLGWNGIDAEGGADVQRLMREV